MTLQNAIAKLTGVAMSLLAIRFYLNGTMALLVCIVMLICAFMIYASLESAGNYSSLLRQVDVCVDKAQAILDLEPMDIDGADRTPATCDIAANDIRFAYDKQTIIDGISVTIPEKTTTAIVGPSGGGKTKIGRAHV